MKGNLPTLRLPTLGLPEDTRLGSSAQADGWGADPNREYGGRGSPNSKAQPPGQGSLPRAPRFLYAIPASSAPQDLG